ncbi:acyl-CoA dehydrogenase family protein [Gordonia sp. NPDC003424]
MPIATSPEQIAVCEAIATWARGVRTTDLIRDDIDKPADRWTELFGQLADFGVFSGAVPEDRGGLGATFTDVAAMLEQCGNSLVPGPLAATVAAAVALSRCDDDRAWDLLAAVAAGEMSVAAPGSAYARRDLPRLRDGEVDLGIVPGHVESGAVLVLLADDGSADSPLPEEPASAGALRSARSSLTGEPRASRRVGATARHWCLIPPGVGAVDALALGAISGTESVSRIRLTGIETSELIHFDDEAVIGGILTACVAAYQSGVARWALDTAVEYAKVRTQFGAPIGSFQAIKHICAEMLCRSEELTCVAWDVAQAVDGAIIPGAGDHAVEQLEISGLAAEVVAADAAFANAKDCIQVLGGIGFTFEHDAHLYLRAAMTSRSVLRQGISAREELGRRSIEGVRRTFDFDLSPVEHRRDEVRATIAEIASAGTDAARRLMAESGLLMPHWPAPYGLAAEPALQLLIDSEFARAQVERPDLVIGAWAIPTILEHGTDLQRDRFVMPTLLGEIIWCQLFSEPEAGSDLAALRTKAIRVDGGWELQGQKIWTSQAHNAQWGVCLARTDPDAPKHKGITYFLVDMTAPGIDIRPLRELTGHAKFNEVFLDGVFVPDDCVVGEVNNGWRLARTTLANERVAMLGAGLGRDMAALLDQIDARTEPLTPGELAGFGALVAEAHGGRVMDARMVMQALQGHDPGGLSSVRKLVGVRHRQAVPEFALEILGVEGAAASESSTGFLQNRCLSIAGGTTQILKTAAAERILGLPRG